MTKIILIYIIRIDLTILKFIKAATKITNRSIAFSKTNIN